MSQVVFKNPWTMKVGPASDGKSWLWVVRYHDKEIGRGAAKTEEKARRAGAEFTVQAMLEKDDNSWGAGRQLARLKLVNYVKRRPYLLVAVINQIINVKADKSRIFDEAEQEERAWFEMDANPMKKPLSTHGRTLPAATAAEQMWDYMVQGGLLQIDKDGNRNSVKLMHWARKKFGPAVFGWKLTEQEQKELANTEYLFEVWKEVESQTKATEHRKFTPRG